MTSLAKQTEEYCTSACETLRKVKQQLAQTKALLDNNKKYFIK